MNSIHVYDVMKMLLLCKFNLRKCKTNYVLTKYCVNLVDQVLGFVKSVKPCQTKINITCSTVHNLCTGTGRDQVIVVFVFVCANLWRWQIGFNFFDGGVIGRCSSVWCLVQPLPQLAFFRIQTPFGKLGTPWSQILLLIWWWSWRLGLSPLSPPSPSGSINAYPICSWNWWWSYSCGTFLSSQYLLIIM